MSAAQTPRPPSAAARARIARMVNEAERHFTRDGFAGATMEAIARGAGVGKATLYAHFASKDALFASVIAAEGARHTETLLLPVAGPDQIAPTLTAFGRDFLDLLLSPPTIAAHRSIAAEAHRGAALGRLFYTSGPARVLAQLADWLAALMGRGLLRPAPPGLAAAQFIGVIRADLHLRVTLGVEPAISADEQRGTVEAGVAMFLRAYAPEPHASAPHPGGA